MLPLQNDVSLANIYHPILNVLCTNFPPPDIIIRLLVAQPPGGVVEGQIFLIPLPDDFAVGEPRVNIPTGRWKDGPFDCLKAGICHPSLWCALCCTQGE